MGGELEAVKPQSQTATVRSILHFFESGFATIPGQKMSLTGGWRTPTREDYKQLAQAQGVVFTNELTTNQEAIKKLVSTNHWRKIAGTNTSGFNGYPAGYIVERSDH